MSAIWKFVLFSNAKYEFPSVIGGFSQLFTLASRMRNQMNEKLDPYKVKMIIPKTYNDWTII